MSFLIKRKKSQLKAVFSSWILAETGKGCHFNENQSIDLSALTISTICFMKIRSDILSVRKILTGVWINLLLADLFLLFLYSFGKVKQINVGILSPCRIMSFKISPKISARFGLFFLSVSRN